MLSRVLLSYFDIFMKPIQIFAEIKTTQLEPGIVPVIADTLQIVYIFRAFCCQDHPPAAKYLSGEIIGPVPAVQGMQGKVGESIFPFFLFFQ